MIGPARLSRPMVKKPKSRPYQASYYRSQAQQVVKLLMQARACAQAAGAPYTEARIRLALSSARGAVRNAEYRMAREQERGSR